MKRGEKFKKSTVISIILIVLMFLIPLILYSSFEEKIAVHWNMNSEPDNFVIKSIGLFLIPIFSIALLLIFLLLPRIDPLKSQYKKFQKYYNMFILLMIVFMTYLQLLIIFWNLGYKFNMGTMMVPALALLFLYIGHILGNLKRNWFIGIRTPWTLSNDTVWDKTHKLGSKLFGISGIIILIGLFFEKFIMWFVLLPIVLSVIWLVLYSYLEWRKINKKK